MTFREFEVPTIDEMIAIHQLTVSPIDSDPPIVILGASAQNSERITLSLDQLGRSIKLTWWRQDNIVLEILREGATQLRFEDVENVLHIRIAFTSDEVSGQITIRIESTIRINDVLTFT